MGNVLIKCSNFEMSSNLSGITCQLFISDICLFLIFHRLEVPVLY